MNHVNWSLEEKTFCVGKPSRGCVNYTQWLEIYEENWYLAVREFPEILYWEIDNELNNKDFMYIQGHFGEKRPPGNWQQCLPICCFVLRGAYTGQTRRRLRCWAESWIPTDLAFRRRIPEPRWSILWRRCTMRLNPGRHGSACPDDFFEVAGWHPYYYKNAPDDYFVEKNRKSTKSSADGRKKRKRSFSRSSAGMNRCGIWRIFPRQSSGCLRWWRNGALCGSAALLPLF